MKSTSSMGGMARALMRILIVTAGVAVASDTIAKEVTVAHYGALVMGAPYAVALEKGYFEQQNVPIDGVVSGKGGGNTVRAALANEIKFGEAGVGAVLAARNKGVDLVIVGAAVSGEVDMYWLVRADSDIQSIDDLKGRKVGYTNPNSGTDMLGKMVWKRAGLGPDDFELVATGGMREGITMLGQGQIDTMPIIEPIATKLQGKFRSIFSFGDYVKAMTQTVAFAERNWLEENGDLVRGILAARRAAVEEIYRDPKGTAKIIARTHGLEQPLADSVVGKFARITYWSPGGFDRAALEVNIEGLELIDALPEGGVDWNEVIDQSYLPEDLRKPL